MPKIKTEAVIPVPASTPYTPDRAIKDDPTQPKLGFPIVKANGVNGKKGPSFVYDKRFLVGLVIKYSTPDWKAISSAIDKSETKCKDMWRKVIEPNLRAGKVWAREGEAWKREDKIKLATMYLSGSKLDWAAIAESFNGRNKTQVQDVWRKVLFPKLKRGDPIE